MIAGQNSTIVRTKEGKLQYAGIDMGGQATLIAEDGMLLVVKWPSHSYWSGIGMPRSYASPTMQVLRRTGPWKRGTYQHIQGSSRSATVELLIEWEVTRKKS